MRRPSVQTKTYEMKPREVKKRWVVIDADGVILGRLAAAVAVMLRGKNSPKFTPSVDCGDNVVIINAEKVRVTGNKEKDLVYQYHTGYPGGIKTWSFEKRQSGRYPERIIQKAVERMMPRGPLARKQLGNLKVYKGAEHPHAAQNPIVIDFAARNPKNKRTK
jgi:large subunit ribosomal protein L13